jgi:hypothetical protein
MAIRDKLSRERLAELVEGAERRTASYLQKWLSKHEVRDELHQLDRQKHPEKLKQAG